MARILFAGLWCIADKQGRLEDRPRRIKSEILPYDDCDIEELLDELACKGFIVRYAVEYAYCIQILNFEKHQSPHKGEIAYGLPSLDSEGVIVVAEKSHEITRNSSPFPSSLIPSSLIDVSLDSSEPGLPDSEPPAPASPESPVVLTYPTVGTNSKEWGLTQAKLDEYRESFPGLDVEAECRKALQWCRDNAANRKTPNGMPKFLCRWLGKAQDYAARPPQNRAPPLQPRTAADMKNLLDACRNQP